jgi:hypothetical protein
MNHRFASLQLALLLSSSALLIGQTTAVVQISGVITDPNGGAVPRAQVKAIQTETGLQRTAVAGPDGVYLISNLPIGPYRLEASADGFRTQAQTGIVLQVNTNPTINVTLQVGSVMQQVEVVGDASMVETQSNAVSQVIDEKRVVDLPLNGRQPTQLVLLSGAAVNAPAGDFATSKNYPSSVTISVAGGEANGTYYLMDGGDHLEGYSSINLPLPFPDVLQEFSVQTNAIQAQYGLRAGAVVNLVTKSGTNELHGDLFEFMRQGVTNARNFFAPVRDNLRRNQFGGTVGGPIVKNKLFLFGGYQGTRLRTAPQTNTNFVPTAAALNGDFSTLESAACAGTARTLINPTTGVPYPGNQVPMSSFNPQALAFLKYVPVSTDPCGKLLISIPNPQDEDQVLSRADWNRSAKNTIFGRYFFTDFRNPAAYDGKDLLLTTRAGVLDRVQSIAAGDTYILSSTAVNSLHVTYSRDHVTRGPASGLPTAQSIGLNVAPSAGNFPSITVGSNFTTFCGTCSLAHINSSSYQFADDFSIVKGRHQIEFGVDWIRRLLDFQVSTQENAAYAFSGQFTTNPTVDLLLGLPSSFTQGNLTKQTEQATYFAMYVQDKIRVTSHLSMTVGMRWEPYFPALDVKGRDTHFDMGAFLAGTRSSVFTNAPPGIFFPGDKGFPEGGAPTNHHWNDFAPRLGLIWDPLGTGKLTIRSAYGILYDIPGTAPFVWFGFGPPYASTVVLTSPAGGFTNPYAGIPGGNPFPQPSPPPANAVFIPGGTYANLPASIDPTYMQQWNLSVQKQFGQAWLLTASYLGNKSTHRWVSKNINPAVYIPGTCGTGPCSSTANTAARRLLGLLSPAGSVYGPIAQLDDGADASYEALLLSVDRRLSRNFSVLANYTWGHCISDGDGDADIAGSYENPNNRSAERGNCASDVRQIFNMSFVAQSPHFSNRLSQRLFGNWELSGILTKRTGFWFSVLTGTDRSLTGIGVDRPNVIGDPNVSNPSLNQWFNASAFQANALGTFGNSGRDNLQGPGALTLDTALIRRFAIREHQALEARAEAFNIMNHPTFNNPRNTLTDSNIGRILTANDPRIFQFALKYAF